MRKLLAANFARLWKDKAFWLGMVVMLSLGVYVILGTIKGNADEPLYALASPDSLLLAVGSFVSVPAALFQAFYIGTEYSDGTMRSKIATGNSRPAVYFSNWIVCACAALMMHLFYVLVVAVLGIFTLGRFVVAPGALLLCVLVSCVSVIAFSSIFLLLAMNTQKKSFLVALLLIFSFLLFSSGSIIANRLAAPEYYEAYTWTDDEGNIHEEAAQDNPSFLRGTKRQVYEFLYDFLPGGQLDQMSEMLRDASGTDMVLSGENHSDLLLFFGYSCLIALVCSGAGVVLFKIKDLK